MVRMVILQTPRGEEGEGVEVQVRYAEQAFQKRQTTITGATTTILAFTGILHSLRSFLATMDSAIVCDVSLSNSCRLISRLSSSVGGSLGTVAKDASLGGLRLTFLRVGARRGATCNISLNIGETVFCKFISTKSTLRPQMRIAPCNNLHENFWNKGLTTQCTNCPCPLFGCFSW